MIARLSRAPKAMLLLLVGLVFGMVWAAASDPGAAAAPGARGVTSVTAGPGLTSSPNPITSTGTISAAFGGDGAATTLSRSDHTHDSTYLRQTGGTMTGDLAFAGNAQLIAPRVENALSAPAGAAAGRLWFDLTEIRLKVHDGLDWIPVPQIFAAERHPARVLGTPRVYEDLDCLVTFRLPAEQLVLIEGGGTGQLLNLVNPNVILGTPVTNVLQIALHAAVDGGPSIPLANWTAGFSSVNQTFPEARSAPTTPVLLPAGTHTLRLKAMRTGATQPYSFSLGPEEYECRISNVWVRVHRT